MIRKVLSLKRCIGVSPFVLCLYLLLLKLHMAYIQGQNITPTVKTPSPVLSPGWRSVVTNFTTTRLPNWTGYKTVSSPCSGLIFPYQLMVKDRWQNVDEQKSAFVFSAYQKDTQVKVIGATVENGSYVCQLWYVSTNTSLIEMVDVAATVNRMAAVHGKKYRAMRITCSLPTNQTGDLLAVSISTSKCHQPINVVPVTHSGSFNVTNKFTMCVAPFSSKFARAFQLIEWIELNRILGADKFVFYNFSSAPNIRKVLESYSNRDLVEVVDWKLPMEIKECSKGFSDDIHYYGQVVSLNDCFLRYQDRSEFLVNLDLDEFIIPREGNVMTWEEMLAGMPKVDVYVFANVYFRKEWNNSRTNFTGYDMVRKYRLVTLFYLKQEKTIWHYRKRAKYIVRPSAAQTLGIHCVWQKTGSLHNVPHNVALSHHYRNWMKYDEQLPRFDNDIVVRKYKDKLLTNVIDRWKSLPNVASDIPLCKQPEDFGAY